MTYVIEDLQGKPCVDLDRFVADLRHHLGPTARIERNADSDSHGGRRHHSVIRFRERDYQLAFETGDRTGGPGRVWVELEPIREATGHLDYLSRLRDQLVMTVSAARAMPAIVGDLYKKILSHVDHERPSGLEESVGRRKIMEAARLLDKLAMNITPTTVQVVLRLQSNGLLVNSTEGFASNSLSPSYGAVQAGLASAMNAGFLEQSRSKVYSLSKKDKTSD